MSDSLIARAAKVDGWARLLTRYSPEEWIAIQKNWDWWARPEQLEPNGDWNTWLILAGRAWGKSRAGAECVRNWAQRFPGCKIALVARTAADVRDVMVRALLTPWRGGLLPELPIHEPSNRLLRWSNGSTCVTFSAEEPDSLRGPQFDFAWCDEVATWQYAENTWHEGVKMCMRGSGESRIPVLHPRIIVTTTPRPTPFVRELVKTPGVTITKGITYDNAANLPDTYIAEMKERYGDSRLGRQELYADLLDDVEGALWKHALIDRDRISRCDVDLIRVVVAVDPSGSAKKTADEAGIVVAGIGDCRCKCKSPKDKPELHAFVFEDLSGRYSPKQMAETAIGAYRARNADRLVAEDNFGGQIIADLVTLVDPTIAYKAVHASRGKFIRAEPVASLYENARVHHVGMFAAMEDEMCSYAPMVETRKAGQLAPSKSPGRLDALVWALTDLLLGEQPASYGDATLKAPRPIIELANTETGRGHPDDYDERDRDDYSFGRTF